MTWREILEGLAALPAALKQLRQLQQVASVRVVSLQPGDVIIVETEQALRPVVRERIAEMVKTIWPDHKVVVWDSGLSMRVVSEESKSA